MLTESRAGAWKVLHTFHQLRELGVTDAPGQTMASSAIRRADQ